MATRREADCLRVIAGNDEEGQGLVEYGLIIFLVAIVIIAILALLGPQIGGMYSNITSSVP